MINLHFHPHRDAHIKLSKHHLHPKILNNSFTKTLRVMARTQINKDLKRSTYDILTIRKFVNAQY